MSGLPQVRRADKLMTEVRAREVLEKGFCGRLATVGEDGWPFPAPLLERGGMDHPVVRAVREVDPSAPDESGLAGVGEGQLAGLFTQAGLTVTDATALTVQVRHATFGDWWQPFTLGVGPAGTYVASLTGERRRLLSEHCRELLGDGPVDVSATAWAVTGHR